jgi:CrcB protein
MAGGALGTLARAGVAAALPVHPGAFPWATLIVNLGGTALLAWLANAPVMTRRLWGTGFCGAFTTFSTLQVEALRLVDHGEPLLAVAYVAVSVTAGLTVARLAR